MRRVRRNKRPRSSIGRDHRKSHHSHCRRGTRRVRAGQALARKRVARRSSDYTFHAQRSRSAAPHRKRHAASRRLGSRSRRRCNPHLHARPRHRRYRRSIGAAWRIQSFYRRTQAAKQQRKSRGKPWQGKIVLHTSGALASDVLRPLALRGAATGSLHPLQTFSGRTLPSLAGSVCVIEGSASALRMARRICRDLGCIAVVLPPRNKAAYHAGAALAAGHILAVFEAAVRMLIEAGFSRKNAIAALLPLTRQTLANYERVGPRADAAQVSLDWPIEPRRFWSDRAASAGFARLPEGIPGSV